MIAGAPPGLIEILLALLAINGATFALFWWDKRQARLRGWRVSEATLLGWALLGGWPGAKLAQRQFRHKTVKRSFRLRLDAIGVLWAALLGLYLYFM